MPESPLKWDETRFMNKLTKVAQVLDSTVAGDGLPALVGLVEIENKEVLEELVSKSQLKENHTEYYAQIVLMNAVLMLAYYMINLFLVSRIQRIKCYKYFFR